MITPNKILSLEDSAMGLLPLLMKNGQSEIQLSALYRQCEKNFESADQFLFAIDVLYVLGRINVNLETGIVSYA